MNGCPICEGRGVLFAAGARGVEVVPCPECAGLTITPASADDALATETKGEAA